MLGICGDNRFEIIAKAKAHLLDATNIDTSEGEMKVLDDFLFRCWGMGWLDRYDESNSSEKPNKSEIPTGLEPQIYCDTCGLNKKCGVAFTEEARRCQNESRLLKDEPQTGGVLFKGNLKEGDYKLIKTTDGWVLEGSDIVYCGTEERASK